MGSGRTIKLTASASTTIQTEHVTKGTGSRISNMEMARKSGLTTRAMRDSTVMERNTVTDSSYGLMVQPILVNSSRTTSMETVSTHGQMVANTMASGRITRWTALAFSPGQMAGSTRESTLTIRRRVMVYSPGLMVVNTTEPGRMVSSTASASTTRARVRSRTASGTKESVSDGSMLKIND